ncbi:hypothetical protein [Aquimarina sp. LLG6339-5]|uniref:hypothetical protein n=1 Tax=Aquimarina sp. LLG6339-5 TaxID=3160830 RepID=UPI00386F22C6
MKIVTILKEELQTLASVIGLFTLSGVEGRSSDLRPQSSDFQHQTTKTKLLRMTHKYILMSIICSFLLCTHNMSAQGPNAPEAAAFEPVDATDMVNLVTGDFSYVLPLLNVPSPEGGYPLALSYHAGIAIDQEASWVGLGWSLNPGAINRGVNGYPDDWSTTRIHDYFYDKGSEDDYYTASVGVGFNGFSAGLSYSWGNNRASGGSVYFAAGLSDYASIGVSVGTNGASLNGSIGLGKNSPFSINANIGTNGVGVGLGVSSGSNTLSLGADISYTGNVSGSFGIYTGEKNKKSGIGFNLSSQGVGLSGKINGAGTGINLSTSSAYKMDDYFVSQSGYYIPVVIPVNNAFINLGFGKQTVKYSLNKLRSSYVTGGINLKNQTYRLQYKCCLNGSGSVCKEWSDNINCGPGYSIRETRVHPNNIMDVDEIGIVNQSEELNLDYNNAVLPNHDTYNVSAQGLSGTIKPLYQESGMLLGLSKEIGKQDDRFRIEYALPDNLNELHKQIIEFNTLPTFNFENEYTSSLIVNPINYNSVLSANDVFDYTDLSNGNTIEENKKKARYVEYFTGSMLENSSYEDNGLLKPNIDYEYSGGGIAGFKITSPDGKTYHYSLPVYNSEIVSRTYGLYDGRRGKEDSYVEKRQYEGYATHWLLTAVTGPDFIDNGDGIASNGDLGYWVNLEYGKWSNSFIWYAPYGEEYIANDEDPNVKSYTWGRKEIFYLDKIKTRTHTALFVKEERLDSRGKALIHKERLNSVTVNDIEFLSQQLLRLKEIILLKNNPNGGVLVNKTNKSNLNITPPANTYISTAKQNYSLQDDILDRNDLTSTEWNSLKNNALKIIDFSSSYSYSLAQETPNSSSGRLTLNGINFKGKKGINSIPPYKFEYNNVEKFNWKNKDDWGYNNSNPSNWSLTKITNPTGGSVEINYESDVFFTAVDHKITFDLENEKYTASNMNYNTGEFFIDSGNTDLGIQIGDSIEEVDYILTANGFLYRYKGSAQVIEQIDSNKFKVKTNDPITGGGTAPIDSFFQGLRAKYKATNQQKGGGLRVTDITVRGNNNSFKTSYDYNKESGTQTSGMVSYIPFSQNAITEAPYGSLLPSPVVMYSNVKTSSYDSNSQLVGYNKYNFKVIPHKQNDKIKFGDILEITSTETNNSNSDNQDVNISDIIIEDNLSVLGQLISTETYNKKGQQLNKVVNNFQSADNITQGIVQQSFQSYKNIDYLKDNNRDKWLINSSTIISYPSSLISTTTYNQNLTNTTNFLTHDLNSGQLLETITTSSDGVEYLTKIIPAYTVPKYSGNLDSNNDGIIDGYGMGSKVDNPTNKNMLTQTAATLTQIKDASGDWKTINANINTWNNDWTYRNYNGSTTTPTNDAEKIWRKHQTFAWKGEVDEDGAYTGYTGDDDHFNWSDPDNQSNAKWIKTSTVSLYDHYSMPLESIDINENKASTKMGDDNSKVFAVANAGYTEMYYSGAEDLIDNTNYFSGEVYKGSTATLSDTYHTGSKAIQVSANVKAFAVTPKAGNYKVSVWAYKGSNTNYTNTKLRTGSTTIAYHPAEVIPAGDWVQLNFYTNDIGANQEIYVYTTSGTVIYDDFRMVPIASSMSSYVYNEWDELTYIIGANNLATKYEYDDAGRLHKTYSEVMDTPEIRGGFKLSKEINYNYGNPTTSDTTNPNALSLSLGIGNPNISTTTLTANANGGSYEYEYRFAIGTSSSNLSYGSWTSSNTRSLTTNCTSTGRRYYKCQVRDKNSGATKESTGNHQRGNCGIGDDDDPIDIIQQ